MWGQPHTLQAVYGPCIPFASLIPSSPLQLNAWALYMLILASVQLVQIEAAAAAAAGGQGAPFGPTTFAADEANGLVCHSLVQHLCV